MNCPVCGRPRPADVELCPSCNASSPGQVDEPAAHPTKIDPESQVRASFASAPPARAGLPPGASLGTRYEIRELLGEGGMGAVYKAYDRELNRTVAIKLIRPEMAERPEVLERFKREILLASKVSHRNVLRIHDLGEAHDVKFISMNYVEGASLKSLLRREGALTVERALPLVRQIGEALAAAHEAGVVHRDLKPQNILIDNDGHAFVADFGISRSLDSGDTMTEAGAILGSVDYMSPEQARGERSDHRGDIYSFGVILYEMFTAQLPFTGTDALSVMMRRLHADPQPIQRVRASLPAWLSEIVARAMSRDPADRYQSIAELMSDLERHRASTSWRRVGRIVLRFAAAAAVLAAAALGIHLWKSRAPVAGGPVTSLVVLPFQNATGDSRYDWARDGLPSLLHDDLLQAKSLRLVGEDRVDDVLSSLRTPAGDESRPATMRKVASLVGAEHVLAGRLLRIGDRLRIEATLQIGSLDENGSVLRVDGAGDDAIRSMLTELTHQVWEAVGVAPGWIERTRGETEPFTHSAQALALHGQARALLRAGEYLEASKRLEEALEQDPGFALARAQLAETYDALGRTEQAAEEAKKAAANLESATSYEAARIRATLARLEGATETAEKAYASLCEITPSNAEAFYDLASIREERGNLKGALEAFRQVVALDPKHPSGHYSVGRLLAKLGNPTDAMQELNVALRLNEETQNEEGKATVLNGLGNIGLSLGQYDQARERFRSAVEIRRRIGDQKGAMKSLTNLALTAARQGRYPEAIEADTEALAIAREIGDRTGIANTCSELGDVYTMAGQAANAMPAYQEALRIFRERGARDAAGEARALGNIGAANTVLGRYGEALYSLKDSLQKRREIGDKGEIMRALSDLGDNERLQGGYERALEYYAEALVIAREIEDAGFITTLLGGLADIHEDQGDYGAALSLIDEETRSAREMENDSMLATAFCGQGSALRQLGDVAGAVPALEEALRLAKATNNDRALAGSYGSLALLRLAAGESERATEAAREALRIGKASSDLWLGLQTRFRAAEVGRSAGNLAQVAKEAGAAGLVPIAAAAHLALARVELAAGRHAAALREADSAAAMAAGLGQRDVLFQAHHLAGLCLRRQGDARAEERFRAAGAALEDMRRGLRDDALKAFLARPETVAFQVDVPGPLPAASGRR